MPKFTDLPIISSVGLYGTETKQSTVLGTLAASQDGRKWRYVQAGASNLVIGNLLQAANTSTSFTDMAVQSAVAVGATTIPVTLGASSTTSTSQFTGGFLTVSVTPGIGQTFTILSNDVASSGTTCNFYILEPVLTALTTSSKITAYVNPYNGVIQQPTTPTGNTVGAAVTAIASGSFGWICTAGVTGILADATTIAVNAGVTNSTTVAGAVGVATAGSTAVGRAVVAGQSTKVELVDLQLD